MKIVQICLVLLHQYEAFDVPHKYQANEGQTTKSRANLDRKPHRIMHQRQFEQRRRIPDRIIVRISDNASYLQWNTNFNNVTVLDKSRAPKLTFPPNKTPSSSGLSTPFPSTSSFSHVKNHSSSYYSQTKTISYGKTIPPFNKPSRRFDDRYHSFNNTFFSYDKKVTPFDKTPHRFYNRYYSFKNTSFSNDKTIPPFNKTDRRFDGLYLSFNKTSFSNDKTVPPFNKTAGRFNDHYLSFNNTSFSFDQTIPPFNKSSRRFNNRYLSFKNTFLSNDKTIPPFNKTHRRFDDLYLSVNNISFANEKRVTPFNKTSRRFDNRYLSFNDTSSSYDKTIPTFNNTSRTNNPYLFHNKTTLSNNESSFSDNDSTTNKRGTLQNYDNTDDFTDDDDDNYFGDDEIKYTKTDKPATSVASDNEYFEGEEVEYTTTDKPTISTPDNEYFESEEVKYTSTDKPTTSTPDNEYFEGEEVKNTSTDKPTTSTPGNEYFEGEEVKNTSTDKPTTSTPDNDYFEGEEVKNTLTDKPTTSTPGNDYFEGEEVKYTTTYKPTTSKTPGDDDSKVNTTTDKPTTSKASRTTTKAKFSFENNCGIDNSSELFVNTSRAKIETYPWLGVLYYRTSGKVRLTTPVVLVTKQLVLAAAMAIHEIPKQEFRSSSRVVLGHNCSHKGLGILEYNYHPEYRRSTYSSLVVVQLNNNDVTQFWNELRPICGPPKYVIEPTFHAMILPNDCKYSRIEVHEMDYVTPKQCTNFYRRTELDVSSIWPTRVVCSKGRSGGGCVWADGTVLAVKQKGRWHLMGFGISGPGCQAPSRFVDYTGYHQWVTKAVRRMGTPSITRLDINEVVIRKTEHIQRFGRCDIEEIKHELYTDSIIIVAPASALTNIAQYNVTLSDHFDYSCVSLQATYDFPYLTKVVRPKMRVHAFCLTPSPICHQAGFQIMLFDVTIFFKWKTMFKISIYGRDRSIIDQQSMVKYANEKREKVPIPWDWGQTDQSSTEQTKKAG